MLQKIHIKFMKRKLSIPISSWNRTEEAESGKKIFITWITLLDTDTEAAIFTMFFKFK